MPHALNHFRRLLSHSLLSLLFLFVVATAAQKSSKAVDSPFRCLRLNALALLLGWLLAGIAPGALAQQITYHYQGKPFTNFSGISCPPDCAISGYLTIPFPPAAPSAFRFTDGSITIDNTMTLYQSGFDIIA